MNDLRFLILFGSDAGERLARTVIESLRAFGGPLRDAVVWAFVPDADRTPHTLPSLDGVQRFPLAGTARIRYPFAEKVRAFTQAEEMAGPEIRSLIWLSLDCLIIQPPLLFDLGPASGAAPASAAFRPVHHQNIGSPALEPLDGYWEGVYQALGIDQMRHSVESFVDRQTLRPYFNTHCFALDPALGLGRAWWEQFKALASDRAFQAGPCRDELHQIFLHQAILSTLVAQRLAWERVRILPPEYNYPLNLLAEMPPGLQPATLNHLVNAVHEGHFPWHQLEVQEPLRSWIKKRLPGRV